MKEIYKYAFIAIHGGKIEPYTDLIAMHLALSSGHPFYINTIGPHIASTKYRCDYLDKLSSQTRTIISMHGCRGDSDFLYIGGRNFVLISNLENSLKKYFCIKPCPKNLLGTNPQNVCNRGLGKQGGVQLELSRGLREKLYSEPMLMSLFAKRILDVLHVGG